MTTSCKTWGITKRIGWIVKFTNMIWDAPPLFVTVHHHGCTSYIAVLQAHFFKPCSLALRIGRRAWWSGWFCTSASHLSFSVGSWSCFRRFAVSMGRFVQMGWNHQPGLIFICGGTSLLWKNISLEKHLPNAGVFPLFGVLGGTKAIEAGR